MKHKIIAGKNVYFFTSVKSTMDTAKKLRAKIKEPVVVSIIQKQGRGRQGNRWISNEGGLWISIVWECVSKKALNYLFFIGAKAIVDTLRDIGIKNPGIKLPNDVFVNGRKIAGVLIENLDSHVIIGIGINVNNAITEEMGTAISCKEILGYNIAHESILYLLLNNIQGLRHQCEKQNLDFLKNITGLLI